MTLFCFLHKLIGAHLRCYALARLPTVKSHEEKHLEMSKKSCIVLRQLCSAQCRKTGFSLFFFFFKLGVKNIHELTLHSNMGREGGRGGGIDTIKLGMRNHRSSCLVTGHAAFVFQIFSFFVIVFIFCLSGAFKTFTPKPPPRPLPPVLGCHTLSCLSSLKRVLSLY